MEPAICLEELFESPPTSYAEREARWAAAVEAVRRVQPALSPGGGPAVLPQDLRRAFEAFDLFVFQGMYRGVFENSDTVYWAWVCASTESPCDAWHLVEEDEEDVLFDGLVWKKVSMLMEIHLHRDRLMALFPADAPTVEPGAPPRIFDDHPARDVVEAIVGAVGRRMMRFAAVYSTGSPEEAEEQEQLLLSTFGSGPGACAADPTTTPHRGHAQERRRDP